MREKIYFPYMCVCVYIYIFLPPPLGLSIRCILRIIHAQHGWHFAPLTLCCGVFWSLQVPVALPYLAAMTTDVFRHCPVSHGRQNCLWSRTTAHFSIRLLFFFFFFFYWAAWAVYIFWRLIPYQLLHLQMLSPSLSVVFVSHLCFFFLLCKSF